MEGRQWLYQKSSIWVVIELSLAIFFFISWRKIMLFLTSITFKYEEFIPKRHKITFFTDKRLISSEKISTKIVSLCDKIFQKKKNISTCWGHCVPLAPSEVSTKLVPAVCSRGSKPWESPSGRSRLICCSRTNQSHCTRYWDSCGLARIVYYLASKTTWDVISLSWNQDLISFGTSRRKL